MIKTLVLLFTVSLVHSCALNKMFLDPIVTFKAETYKVYSPIFNDTVSLAFHPINNPVLTLSNDQIMESNYSINNSYFINSSGDSTNYWLITPDRYNGTTIYFLHGNKGNIPLNFPLAEPFAKKGYQVFMLDYSGFGYSNGKLKRKNVLSDGNDGIDHLIKTVTYDKLIVYGQSLGGHLSCTVAQMNQDKIDGLVIEGAFSSHKDIAAEAVPVLSRIVVREMYSGEKNLTKLNKPVLVIHSTEDARIPFDHGQKLFSIANEPKMFYQIEKRHIFGPLYYIDSITEKIETLLTLSTETNH
jgi:pimeloyl-ACP methyl ester carboxylesterase